LALGIQHVLAGTKPFLKYLISIAFTQSHHHCHFGIANYVN
jgi:hypothetical protein